MNEIVKSETTATIAVITVSQSAQGKFYVSIGGEGNGYDGYANTIESAREIAVGLIADWDGFEAEPTETNIEIAVENDTVYVVESGKASNGQIIRAYAEYRDYADEPYIIRWHAGGMPSHHTETFDNRADFIARMGKVADLAEWQIFDGEDE